MRRSPHFIDQVSLARLPGMKIFNLNSDEWDGTKDREGWRIERRGRRPGASAVS